MLGLWERRSRCCRYLFKRHETETCHCPLRCCMNRACFSWTNRLPGLTRKPLTWCGTSSPNSKGKAGRSSFARITWMKPTGFATVWGYSRPDYWCWIAPAALRKSVFGRKVVFHLRNAKESLAGAVRQLDFVTGSKSGGEQTGGSIGRSRTPQPGHDRALVKCRRRYPVHRGIALFAGRSVFATGKECLRQE